MLTKEAIMHEMPKFPSSSEKQHKEKVVEKPLEEIVLQDKVRESLPALKGSANRWAWMIVDSLEGKSQPSRELLAELLLNQKNELPMLISAVLERTCNLQCAHCLYQKEKSSAALSKSSHLDETILGLVSQLPLRSEDPEKPYEPQFMSAGRILRPEHLKLFTALRAQRPDVALGVIDNGTFVALLEKGQWPADFRFDWMDISIDGLEESHNQQRQSPKAFAQALEGLQRAREVTKAPSEGGRVTSLLTLTKINAGEIKQTADTLLQSDTDGLPLIDQFRVTTVSPTNSIIAGIEASTEDFSMAWEQIKEISHQYNTPEEQRVVLAIYRIQDLEKLATVVGEKKFLEKFQPTDRGGLEVQADRNFLYLDLDGVRVQYLPLSIWTPEEFLIEADSTSRTAYEGQFTLEELRSGTSKDGRDTTPYTLETLTAQTNLREAFERGVDAYWTRFGKERLVEEMAVFARIQARANG